MISFSLQIPSYYYLLEGGIIFRKNLYIYSWKIWLRKFIYLIIWVNIKYILLNVFIIIYSQIYLVTHWKGVLRCQFTKWPPFLQVSHSEEQASLCLNSEPSSLPINCCVLSVTGVEFCRITFSAFETKLSKKVGCFPSILSSKTFNVFISLTQGSYFHKTKYLASETLTTALKFITEYAFMVWEFL